VLLPLPQPCASLIALGATGSENDAGDRRRHGWTGTGYHRVLGIGGPSVSRWHWRLVVVVGIGTFFDLYEVFLGGVLAPVLAKEFGLGTLGKSMVIAAGFAGMFIGANVLSIAADRLGRRRVFILNLLVYSLFSFAAAFSLNIETFLVLRVIAGIGLGAELVLIDTYLAEFIPARYRGRMTAWAYTIGFLGVPLAALLGGKLVARTQLLGIDGWRGYCFSAASVQFSCWLSARCYRSPRAGSRAAAATPRPARSLSWWWRRSRLKRRFPSRRSSRPGRLRMTMPAASRRCCGLRSGTIGSGP
jgi:MFS family permease